LGNAQHTRSAHQAAVIVNCLDQPKLSNLDHIPPVELQIAEKVWGAVVANMAVFAKA
jgi:hypothetical protein